mmetsp:Transcript_53477/g.114361  ORF Transcript_53477/g.114361 Transcript_53477/m.114361 type:complete len:80 (+) Transcript_53477:277-516(+)
MSPEFHGKRKEDLLIVQFKATAALRGGHLKTYRQECSRSPNRKSLGDGALMGKPGSDDAGASGLQPYCLGDAHNPAISH